MIESIAAVSFLTLIWLMFKLVSAILIAVIGALFVMAIFVKIFDLN